MTRRKLTRVGERAPVDLRFGDAARGKLLRGAAVLARAVGCTLGPWGKAVVIENEFGKLTATRDGVTVARAVRLADPAENMGCLLLAEAALRVVRDYGDGTTTTVVVAERLMREASRLISSGVDPYVVAASIKEEHRIAEGLLLDMTRPMEPEDLDQVVATACTGERRSADPVIRAFRFTGDAGTIVIRDSDTQDTVVDLQSGMSLDRGWHQSFDPDSPTIVLDDCFVFTSARAFAHAETLFPIMEFAAQARKSLLVVAKAVTGSALQTLVGNSKSGVLPCCVVIAPHFHHLQRSILEDVAAWCAGSVDDLPGQPASPTSLGFVRTVRITKTRTVMQDSNPDRRKAETRLAYLRRVLPNMDNEYDADRISRSVGRLHGKVADIAVGAPSDAERQMLKAQVEDAIGAIKSAAKDGLLPGAGHGLVRAATSLSGPLAHAMREPARRIQVNGGFDPARSVANALAGIHPAGVADPTAVVCAALRAACSVVVTMLLSETTLTYQPELGVKRGGWVLGEKES